MESSVSRSNGKVLRKKLFSKSKKKEMTKDRDERRTNDDPILKALDKEEE